MSASCAAAATTCSAWALISSVAAETSSAAALFSSDTAAIELIDWVTVADALAIDSAPCAVWPTMRAISSDEIVTCAAACEMEVSAVKTWSRAALRTTVASSTSTSDSAWRRPMASPCSTSDAPDSIAETASAVPR